MLMYLGHSNRGICWNLLLDCLLMVLLGFWLVFCFYRLSLLFIQYVFVGCCNHRPVKWRCSKKCGGFELSPAMQSEIYDWHELAWFYPDICVDVLLRLRNLLLNLRKRKEKERGGSASTRIGAQGAEGKGREWGRGEEKHLTIINPHLFAKHAVCAKGMLSPEQQVQAEPQFGGCHL